jgi:hypothetical protein
MRTEIGNPNRSAERAPRIYQNPSEVDFGKFEGVTSDVQFDFFDPTPEEQIVLVDRVTIYRHHDKSRLRVLHAKMTAKSRLM